MPSPSTLSRWSKPDFDCPYGCKYHGWHNLSKQINAAAQKRIDRGDIADASEENFADPITVVPEDEAEETIAKYVPDKLRYAKFLAITFHKGVESLQSQFLRNPQSVKEALEVGHMSYHEGQMLMNPLGADGVPSEGGNSAIAGLTIDDLPIDLALMAVEDYYEEIKALRDNLRRLAKREEEKGKG